MFRGPRVLGLAVACAAVLGAGLIGAHALTSSEQAEPAVSLPPGETARLLDGIPQSGTVLGSPDAPATLVEYGDLQCPYCASWATGALPELVRDYVRPGKLRIEFRGLAFIGPDSDAGLRAALAAANQGKLWHVVDLLYRNQGAENSGWLTDDLLRQVGTTVPGLDVERMLGGRAATQQEVEAARAAAVAAGIQGTPAFEVGPTGGALQRVEISALDAAALRPAIDAALAG
jgi:protein-disulfide isomerase